MICFSKVLFVLLTEWRCKFLKLNLRCIGAFNCKFIAFNKIIHSFIHSTKSSQCITLKVEGVCLKVIVLPTYVEFKANHISFYFHLDSTWLIVSNATQSWCWLFLQGHTLHSSRPGVEWYILVHKRYFLLQIIWIKILKYFLAIYKGIFIVQKIERNFLGGKMEQHNISHVHIYRYKNV